MEKMATVEAKYVRYIGNSPIFDKDVGYSCIGIDSGGYRVWTDLYDDAMIFTIDEVELIPEDELKNYKLDPQKTYRDLYEQDFQESSEGLSEEECKYYFLKDVSKTGKRTWYRDEVNI